MDFFVLCLFLSYPIYRLVRYERMRRYFASPVFLAQKQEVAAVVAEHNEVSAYVAEMRENGNFSIGRSSTGSQAGLATYNNTSRHNYNRNRNIADYASSNVHNCGLQVVRNASADPIKYLIKYFDISATEEKLAEIESMGESISRLENAVQNLGLREASIAETISPPPFIVKHYLAEFLAQVGLFIPTLTIPYPHYVFQYVSAGGNSSQEARIILDSPVIDALMQTLSEKIKFKKSAAGQRSLMTARFRDYIKIRDNYACKLCKVSIHDQTHLLLEVDHIIPVSRGGLSVEENLQTLCWKCNRSKSNKY